jgi:hypothetical protein
MKHRSLVTIILLAFMGAFSGMTICWIIWGLVTIGDFFAGGSSLALLFTVASATGTGGYIGFKAKSNISRIVLGTVTLFCILFWMVIPDGWWALPPPPKPTELVASNAIRCADIGCVEERSASFE